LENANISVPSAHPHYALVQKIPHQTMRAAIKLMHNIELVEFSVGQYQIALDALTDLRDKVQAKRASMGGRAAGNCFSMRWSR
jgi:hypothetical protein